MDFRSEWRTRSARRRLSGPAILLRGAHWYLITRIRGSFADVGYATLLVISLNIYNFLIRFLNDEVNVSLASRLHGAVQSAIVWNVLTLPSILILSVALRLAPPQGGASLDVCDRRGGPVYVVG